MDLFNIIPVNAQKERKFVGDWGSLDMGQLSTVECELKQKL